MPHRIITTKSSITGEDLYIMVHSYCIPSRIREIMSRHAPNMQDLTSVMVFLGK